MANGFGRFLRQNTIALLALFLALPGTTYAASTALIGKSAARLGFGLVLDYHRERRLLSPRR